MGRWLWEIALALGTAAVAIALPIATDFLTTEPSPDPAMLLAPERRWHLAAVVFLGMASVGFGWLHSRQAAASQSHRISGSTLAHSTAMQADSGRDTYQIFGTAHFPERPELSREDIQNRRTLLGKVKAFWIDNFLKAPNSLYSRARLALDMESQPHRIRPHVEVALPDQEPVPLPQGTRLIDQVDRLPPGGTLLVLGEPGGGKTTLLLELASDLIDRTEPSNPAAQIPVMLNLSSWSSFQANPKSGDPFAQWLVNALTVQYQVSKAQGADWLAQQQLLLLLDGLDEVAESRRLECLNAIQQFYQGHGRTPLVVCCRVHDFEELATTPKFHGTVYIRLLSADQIERYLIETGEPLAGVRAALAMDADLQAQDPDSLCRLAETPLFLNIISMAYRGKTAEEIAALGQQGQRVALFDTYIERMFQQRPAKGGYTKANVLRWLHLLAMNMGQETVFLIERMQPKVWISTLSTRVQYCLMGGLMGGLLLSLILSLTMGLIMGLIGDLIPSPLRISALSVCLIGPIMGSIAGLIAGLMGDPIPDPVSELIRNLISNQIPNQISGLIMSLMGDPSPSPSPILRPIEPVEAIQISVPREARREIFRKLMGGLLLGLLLGLLSSLLLGLLSSPILNPTSVLIVGPISGPIPSPIMGLMTGLIMGLIMGLMAGLAPLIEGFKSSIQQRTEPNQGIRNSAKNAAIFGGFLLVLGLLLGQGLSLVLGGTLSAAEIVLIVPICISMPVYIGILHGGGEATAQHVALRTVLWLNGLAPRDIAAFLDFAAERRLVQRVGGGYVFLHRLLLEHFADPDFAVRHSFRLP